MIDLIVLAAFSLLLNSGSEPTCKRTDEVSVKIESHMQVDSEGYCLVERELAHE